MAFVINWKLSDPTGTFFELFYGRFKAACKYSYLIANYL